MSRHASREQATAAEERLFLGYAARLRIERCACGGTIAAQEGDWTAISAEVLVHSRSTRHLAWRGRWTDQA